tara:strand:+ start:280 stop:999 length:720 start_codon:yes stop_codon:yes gene_type:complete
MGIGNPITLTGNVATKTITKTATASQTLFTVDGGYSVGQMLVFKNGLLLVEPTDYTANDGSSVTLASGATGGDKLQFQVFEEFDVANAITSSGNQTISGDLTVSGTITGITSVIGSSVGIQSGGTLIGTGQTINFIGSGNTVLDKGDGTIDVSIAGGGGGGGGLGTAINYSDGSTASPFSYIDAFAYVTEDLDIDTTNGGATTSYVVSVSPNVQVISGVGLTVGAGKTMIIDILNIGDL